MNSSNMTSTSPQQSHRVLDGKFLSGLIKKDIAEKVAKAVAAGHRKPGLGVVLVGENPASKTYVANKEKFAAECGFAATDVRLGADSTITQVRDAIKRLNQDQSVDGILLQLPLPKHLDANQCIPLIHPAKDADGLHPLNQGLLLRGEGGVRPCTPQGSLAMIDLALHSGGLPQHFSEIKEASLAGKRAVVIGRSILVGKPVALMLLERNATVTQAHSKTADLPEVCREADIIVAAVGIPNLVKADWIKPGAIVIDVGINRLDTGKLTGDVAYEECAAQASAITPVPGGVGPMTVAMLIRNTYESYARTEKL